jgi:Polyketide cyclase / dehydrase and lipid transport
MGRVGTVHARATATIAAPPERVLELLRDYDARSRLLTSNYSAFRVDRAGAGETVLAFHFAAGGRERDYRLKVEEAGARQLERDELSSFVNTWTVAPAASGSTVTLEATWNGAGGVGGIFEGLFAPLGLKRIYAEVLTRLASTAAQ